MNEPPGIPSHPPARASLTGVPPLPPATASSLGVPPPSPHSASLGQPPFPPPPSSPRQRGWFARNWKWFLPLIVIGPIVLCCGGVSAIFGGVFGMMKSSEPYKHAVRQAQADPRVTAVLGTPVEPRFFVSGK